MNGDGVVLPGSERDPLPGAQIIGIPNPARIIGVTVVLHPREAARHSDLVTELGGQALHARRYFSREEFAAVHGADPAAIAQVRRFARENRLTIVGPRQARTGPHAVELRGTIAAFSRAFGVDLRLYRHRTGIYRGRTGPIHVPKALENVVHAVLGLDNRRHARPRFRRLPYLGGGWAHVAGMSYAPNEIAKLYNFPNNVNGAGQTIALIELGGGYRMPDLVQYFASIGVSPAPSVAAVSVLGAVNRPTGPNGPDGEVMLDIEVAGSIAPGSQIAVYFAPNTDRGFLAAINAAIHDNVRKPSVVSISWGGPEAAWTKQAMTAFDQAFQAGAVLGVTVCCAAGDGGSTDGVRDGRVHADFPASSPNVLACGGTRLVSASGAISSESVWNDGAGDGATGGGVSEFFPLPSWQGNANVPPSGNPTAYKGRGIPDVAGDADPVTGYKVRVDGLDTIIGGTSAVAPLWAGLIALANQSLGNAVGYLTPLLYQQVGGAPSAFRDITEGNNDNTGLGRGYSATRGWDACSGFGSPNGSAIIAALGGPQTGARPQTEAAPDARSRAASARGVTPPPPAAEPGVTPPPPAPEPGAAPTPSAAEPTQAPARPRATTPPPATPGRPSSTRRSRSSNGDDAMT